MLPPLNVLLPQEYWAAVASSPADGRYAPVGHLATLKANEVFVFGSNATGFHGAGAAGWAYTGKTGNQYRAGNPLLQAPKGTKGFWAVLGQGYGYQEGASGRSYAICTIERPGAKRSVSLQAIKAQVLALYGFAAAHPELTFLVPQSGTPGKPSLNGYTFEENASVWF